MTFYNFIKGLAKLVFMFIYRIKVRGIENIPEDGKVVICSNHASLLDPIFIGITLKRQIHFMAKKELFSNKILGSLLRKLGTFPVDRQGADLSAIRNSLKLLKNDKVLGIFPEGTRVKGLDLDSVKPGTAMISIKGKSPIIPVYINSSYKLFRNVEIIYGEPIIYENYFNSKLDLSEYRELSKDIMKNVYSLKSTI